MSLTFVPTATVFDSDSGNLAIGGAWGAAFATAAGGNLFLYVSGSSEGGISDFAVGAAGQLTNAANIHDDANLHLGGTAGIVTFSFGGQSYVYSTAFTDNSVNQSLTHTDGSISIGIGNHYTDAALAGAIDVVGIEVGVGDYVVIAGYNANSITSMQTVSGGFTGALNTQIDDGTLNLAGVRSLATMVIGGTTYVVAAGQSDNGLSIFTINSLGTLAPYTTISDDATMKLGGASAVATATVAGEAFIFAAGVNDHGISVFRILPFPGGFSAFNAFNIGDTASLHLNEVYDLVTANIAGTTYLFAAGLTDDGVDAFAVAPDGTLVSMGGVADTAGLALNGAAQLATTVIGGNTYLAVTGQQDNGVSLFRIDPAGFTITGTAVADLIDATHAPAHQLRPSQFGDTISGLGGNDVISGLGGNDTLNGNDGNDTLNGGAGADHMNGGAGNDIFIVDVAGDVLTDTGGIDRVIAAVTRTLAAGFENLTLSGTANIAGTGNTAVNVIAGNGGNNTLSGLAGNDIIRGFAGSDTIRGGTGNDKLTGGTGNDFFVFNNAPNATTNRDTITDFTNASGNNDTFRLENAVFTKLGAAGLLKPAFFFAGTAAHDADDHIIYDHGYGKLYYDSNGNAAGGVIQLATLTNYPTLTAHDFVVI